MLQPDNESKIVHTNVSAELQACCARHLPAIIAQPESATVVKGAFSLLREDRLRFEVRGQAGAVFKGLAPAVVSYIVDGQVHVLVGSITIFEPSASTGYLTMTLPQFIIQPEMRRHFRLPPVDPGRIQVRMKDQGYSMYEPKVVDISAGGLLVEFPLDSEPRLDSKSALHLELQLDEQIANYLAEVRHTRPGRYGLMFIESPDAIDAQKEEKSLKTILAEIEKTWLAQGK